MGHPGHWTPGRCVKQAESRVKPARGGRPLHRTARWPPPGRPPPRPRRRVRSCRRDSPAIRGVRGEGNEKHACTIYRDAGPAGPRPLTLPRATRGEPGCTCRRRGKAPQLTDGQNMRYRGHRLMKRIRHARGHIRRRQGALHDQEFIDESLERVGRTACGRSRAEIRAADYWVPPPRTLKAMFRVAKFGTSCIWNRVPELSLERFTHISIVKSPNERSSPPGVADSAGTSTAEIPVITMERFSG